MRIFGYTAKADQLRDQFEKVAANSKKTQLSMLYNKMKVCDYDILLVSPHRLIPEKLNDGWYDPEEIVKLHNAWAKILRQDVEQKAILKRQLAVINRIGEPLSPNFQENDNAFIKRFRNDPAKKRFFILLDGKEPDILPLRDLYFLCNLYQLEHNYSLIHSAGIIHKDRLFIFSGEHGAGKSTLAGLSERIGDTVVDEDLILIPPMPVEGFSALAWGYSLRKSTAPLCAIIKIVQDDDDRLIPIQQPQAAHFLVERSIEVFGNILHDNMMEKLFKQISAIVQSVPAYELHFRKSPDFWKLIDEQIPN